MLISLLLLLGVACRDTTLLGPHAPAGREPRASLSESAPTLIAATDFSEYPAGQEPADWTRRWTATGTASWTVQRDGSGDFAGDSKLVLQVAAGHGAQRALSWSEAGERSALRAHTRLRMAAVTHRLAGVILLGGGLLGSKSGYAWILEKEDGFTGLRLKRVKNGQNATTLASHAASLSANTFHHLVLEKKGDSLRAKSWPDGTAEPDWQVAVTDTLLEGGWAGFGNYSPGTVEFDFLRVYSPGGEGILVPEFPPDSLPSRYYDDPVWIEDLPCSNIPFLRNIVGVWFKHGTRREQKQAALDRIGGSLVGGVDISQRGLYIVHVEDDGSGSGVCEAVRILESLPQVELAHPSYRTVPNYPGPEDGK